MSWGNGAPRGWPEDVPASIITGNGTLNYHCIFTGAQTIGNSLVKEVGGNVVLQGTAGLRGPKDLILNTSKTNSFTPLQLQGSGVNMNFRVDNTGNIWEMSVSATAGNLIVNGNGKLILNAQNGNINIQDMNSNAIGDVHYFLNVLAMGIPAGIKISGRNSTDSARRTAIIRMSPTIDNCLEFNGVNRFNFTDDVQVIRGAANNFAFNTLVTGDVNDRLLIQADGKMQWGDGTNPLDTTLERSAAGRLKISNNLIISNNLSISKTTFESWDANLSVLQLGGNSSLSADTAEGINKEFHFAQNCYTTGAGSWFRISADEVSWYNQRRGTHRFFIGATGTADSGISWTTALIIFNDAVVSIGKPTEETWAANYSVLQLGGNGSIISHTVEGAGNFTYFNHNTYTDGTWKAVSNDEAGQYYQSNGTHIFRVSNGVVAADAAINWVMALKIDNTGKLGINITTIASAIHIGQNAGGNNMGYMTLEEIAADAAAPAANRGVLYLKDVGGKTALYVRFPTGAVQQIAIEP